MVCRSAWIGTELVAFAAAILAGCGAQTTLVGSPQRPPQAALDRPLPRAASWRNLYIASYGAQTVTVYSPGSFAPVRSITKGIRSPLVLAFDKAGNGYVGNTNSVTVYSAGSNKLLRRIDLSQGSGCIVFALAFDHAGYLYVACFSGGSGPGYVAIYPPQSTQRLATITDHIDVPVDIAVDRGGNIFIANAYDLSGQAGWISVYVPGTTRPLRLIKEGFNSNNVPARLAFDASGYLYVANTHDITIYAPGSGQVYRTIDHGVDFPHDIAFGVDGDLYVANCTSACSRRGSVTVFAPGKARPMQAITRGIDTPVALTVDAFGALYVANRDSYAVTIYAPRRAGPIETISAGLGSPSALAIGP